MPWHGKSPDEQAPRHTWRSIARNGGWIFADRVLRQGLAVLIGAWVARQLGPARYGELAYALAYLAFFQAVAMLGADPLLVRDLARERRSAPTILGSAFALRLAAGALAWAAAIAGMALLPGARQSEIRLVAMAGGMLVFQAADLVDLWFQSQGQSRRSFAARVAGTALSALLRIGLILLDAPLAAFALMFSIEALLCAAGLVLAYRAAPAAGRWSWSAGRAKELLRQAWPLLLGGLAVVTYIRVDQIMVQQLLGSASLGMYAAILPLSQAAQFLPMSLAAALAPLLAQRKQEGAAAYERELLRVFRLFGTLGLAAAACIALLAPWIVPLLYGPAYRDAVPVLMLHACSNFFVFQGVAQGLWVANEGATTIALAKTLVGAATAVGANLALLPRFGLLGAAFAAVLAQAMSAVLCNIVLAPRVGLMQLGLRPPPLKQQGP